MQRTTKPRGNLPVCRQFFLSIAGALFVASLLSPRACLGDESELNEATFRRLQEDLQPGADEPWRTIPWKIALLDAQRTAAQEKKPIFIWAMDGHPLGCT